MARLTIVLTSLVCIVGGAVIGTAAGVGAAMAVGRYGQWRYPNDPSAGSGGIIIIITAPAGFLLGVMGGAFCADRWMRRSKSRGFDIVPGSDVGSRRIK